MYIGAEVRRAGILLTLVGLNAAGASDVSIRTKDSLSVAQGVYSSLFFVAEPERTTDTNLPVQYRITESGEAPPGMIFEPYPCNKPDPKVCPQLASANGVFLDGTPANSGSYTFSITAADSAGRQASQQFTVLVKAK